jgi:hypothetical protein
VFFLDSLSYFGLTFAVKLITMFKRILDKVAIACFLLLVILLNSCATDEQTSPENNQEQVINQALFNGQLEYTAKMDAIDANEQLKKLNSLSFTNNAKSTAEAIAFLDEKDSEVKIIEKFNDAVTGNYGSKTFYIEKGKVFCAKEVYFDAQISTPSFVERITYFQKNSQVKASIERYAAYEEELDQSPFKLTAKKNISINRALSILNHTGDFETTFQGFLTHNNMDFILVGKNTPDGFTSALSIQSQNATVIYLQKNERKMVGTLLDVSHSFIVDGSGMTFQVLNDVTIIQPKK